MRDHFEEISSSLPAALHMEIAILGAMLLDAVALADATSRLVVSDFSLDSHQRVYRCAIDMLAKGEAVDFLTVQDELTARGELDTIGGPAYLAYLSEGIPRNLNIESYVRSVKAKSVARQVHAICYNGTKLATDPGQDIQELISDLSQQILEASEAGRADSGFAGALDIVRSRFGGNFDSVFEPGERGAGIATGFLAVDNLLGGLRPSELIIVAARPSMGKTGLAMNIAQYAAVHLGKTAAVFSLEMDAGALLRRMIAAEAQFDGRKMERGNVAADERRRGMAGLEKIANAPLFIDDAPGLSVAEIRARARALKIRQGSLDLIVIDYLQLMSGGTGKRKAENRTQEVSAISRGLKALAKEMRCPVVALSQLSRESERRSGDKRPILSDLRESGAIEQDADVVAFIHREEYYAPKGESVDPELQGKAEIIIAKQRNGPTGTAYLHFIHEQTRFANSTY